MLRSAVLKSGFGAGLVAAGQASRPADASARQIAPTTIVRSTQEKVDSPRTSEDTWLDVTVNERGTLVFTPTEVNEVVEEIQNLNLENEADHAIDTQNAVNRRQTMNEMLRASQMMLEDPHVQNACMGAIAKNPELRELVESISEVCAFAFYLVKCDLDNLDTSSPFVGGTSNFQLSPHGRQCNEDISGGLGSSIWLPAF